MATLTDAPHIGLDRGGTRYTCLTCLRDDRTPVIQHAWFSDPGHRQDIVVHATLIRHQWALGPRWDPVFEDLITGWLAHHREHRGG